MARSRLCALCGRPRAARTRHTLPLTALAPGSAAQPCRTRQTLVQSHRTLAVPVEHATRMGSAKKKQRKAEKAAAASEGKQKVERRFGSTSIDAVVPSSTAEWKEPQGTCWSALPTCCAHPGVPSLCSPPHPPTRCVPPSRLSPAAASPPN